MKTPGTPRAETRDAGVPVAVEAEETAEAADRKAEVAMVEIVRPGATPAETAPSAVPAADHADQGQARCFGR